MRSTFSFRQYDLCLNLRILVIVSVGLLEQWVIAHASGIRQHSEEGMLFQIHILLPSGRLFFWGRLLLKIFFILKEGIRNSDQILQGHRLPPELDLIISVGFTVLLTKHFF